MKKIWVCTTDDMWGYVRNPAKDFIRKIKCAVNNAHYITGKEYVPENYCIFCGDYEPNTPCLNPATLEDRLWKIL